MPVNKYLRRRCLLTVVTLLLSTAGAIEWGETTSSSSSTSEIYTAALGEVITIPIGAGERASIDFTGEPSNHFAVSYKQCSAEASQPLQIQYSGKLSYLPFPGGCLYAQNDLGVLGPDGCTFWQYNPSENYQASGVVYEDEELLEPGRVRFENQGDANATVDVAMFSLEVPVPTGLVDSRIWIEDSFTKKDNVVNTTVNVYFNNDESYCMLYTCTVSGYVNDYVEGQDSMSICEVQETGTLYYDAEPFNGYIPLTFTLPEGEDFYVSLILSAKETRNSGANLTALQEYGLDQIMVFQTDTTQPDNGARVLAGLSLVTLTWLILFNALFSTLGSASVQHERPIPALGW